MYSVITVFLLCIYIYYFRVNNKNIYSQPKDNKIGRKKVIMLRSECLDKLSQIKEDVNREVLQCIYEYQKDVGYDANTMDLMTDVIDYVEIDCLPHSQFQHIEDGKIKCNESATF